MKYSADIIIKLKKSIRDPQGSTIETVLKRTEIDANPKVNAGKFFNIEIQSNSIQNAKNKVELIAKEILSNPILEEFEIIRLEEL